MALRLPRFTYLIAVVVVGMASLAGLAAAQIDEILSEPSTSRSSETVVLTDTFDDQGTGIIPPYEPPSGDFSAEYDAGLFDLDALADTFTGAMVIPFGETFSDVSVAIDAVLSGGTIDQPARYIFLTCRTNAEGGGYRMEFRPQSSSVIIRKLAGDAGEQLANGEFNNGAPTTESVRLELSCLGSSIIARVDGVDIVQAEDSDFTEGGLDLGGGVYTISSGRVSVDFDNLAVAVPNALAPSPAPPATPTPEPTLEPSSTPTLEPTAEPTVEPTPTIDRSAIMAPVDQLRTEAMATDPIFGPENGSIEQVVGGSLDAQYGGVAVANFMAQITFINPAGTAEGRWDMGFGFRQTVSGQHWRVIVRSDGTWSLAIAAEFPRATGVVETLNRQEGGSNTIELLADGPVGYLVINDSYTAMLDLSALEESGDIWAGSGFFLDYATSGATTEYTDFTVWSIGDLAGQPQIGSGQPSQEEAPSTPTAESAEVPIATPVASPVAEATPVTPASPQAADDAEGAAVLQSIRDQVAGGEPVFGPSAGEVTQGVGSIDIESASVDLVDFYTSVRFSNPASAEEPDHPWDVLVGFWHEGGDDQIRLVVASDGTWSAAQGTARPTVSGEVGSIVLGAARGNVIELAVVDGAGHLAINGEFVASFAVPGAPQAGDIWIASGTFPENVQPGVVTPFSEWSVWSLE